MRKITLGVVALSVSVGAFLLGRVSAQDVEPSCEMCPATHVSAAEIERYVAVGRGEACAEIVREVDDPGIMVNYDAGNVMDYLDVDPIPDIKKCAAEVRSFCIKDHRNHLEDRDCGPGLGEIDHYRLLEPVAFMGLKMPLCCENIFAPLVPRPRSPEGVDALARRAREFLEIVTQGLAEYGKRQAQGGG